MKVLISSYACESGRGGEGEIGWRLVHHLARTHDVFVVTRANLQAVHQESFLRTPKPETLNFIYFDLPWIFRFYKRGRRLFLLYYYLWQIGIGIKARGLVRSHKIDVLHHLVGGMDWMPAGLALARGPLVWGPVGSENTHPRMRRTLPPTARLKDRLRSGVRWAMRTLDPLVALSARRASIILSHTPETMPRRYSTKLRPFVQTGIENVPEMARGKTRLERNGRLQLVFAGELKDWKGARLALEAALHFFDRDSASDLTIVGDGPLKTPLEMMARASAHADRVRFTGRLSMEELVGVLHGGDVFLYPSFHHGMATVVLQAMLTGLPVICVEGDAIGRAVGQKSGITLQLDQTMDPAKGLARALLDLAEDEPRRQSLAKHAQKVAIEQFSYAHLAHSLGQIYDELVANQAAG